MDSYDCETDIDDVCVIEEFDKQCGEVFLSVDGNLSFLCTLCGLKYHGYQSYADHIYENHHSSNSTEENESINNDDQIHLKYLCDETETEPTEGLNASELDVGQLEEGFEFITDIDFDAPVPDNCGEIEQYSAALRNMNDTLHLPSITNSIEIDKKADSKKTVKVPKTTANTKPTNTKTRRYRCPKCDFVTKSYSTVMLHIARHIGEKRHFCPQCNKGFYTSTELRVHMRSHTGERPYLCTECGQRFVTSSALWRHTKSCKDIRDKECPKCEMKFHDSVALRNHLVVHSEQRSFVCALCDARFKLPKSLGNHMKIHENKHEFKCRFCPASFNQQPGLFSHVKNKHSRVAPTKNK